MHVVGETLDQLPADLDGQRRPGAAAALEGPGEWDRRGPPELRRSVRAGGRPGCVQFE
jgi:hypothetical protein